MKPQWVKTPVNGQHKCVSIQPSLSACRTEHSNIFIKQIQNEQVIDMTGQVCLFGAIKLVLGIWFTKLKNNIE